MGVTESDVFVIANQIGMCAPPLVSSESTARAAISRAYYAAFHAALGAYADARPSPVIDPGHTGLTHWLRTSKLGYIRDIGETLEELRKLRVQADYFLAESPNKQELLLRLPDAQRIVRERPTLAAAIRKDLRAAPERRNATR